MAATIARCHHIRSTMMMRAGSVPGLLLFAGALHCGAEKPAPASLPPHAQQSEPQFAAMPTPRVDAGAPTPVVEGTAIPVMHIPPRTTPAGQR